MSWTLIFLALYLLVQLGIGYWISRRIKSDNDYFLAGRTLGFGFATMSIFATWFGAETCMGSSAAIFENGLSGGRADPFGYAICLLLMSLLLAAPLRKLNLVTIGDLFGLRYSKTIEKIAVLILLPGTILWSAAQVRALGQIVTVLTPLDFSQACILAALFVIIYTSMGGLMGDVIHDVVQGGVLILGLGILLFVTIHHLGGVEAALKGIDTAKLSFVAPGESWLQRMDGWAIPILGSLMAQELVSRVLACRDVHTAKKSSLAAAGVYLVVGLIPVIIGLLGPQMNLELVHRDQFLVSLAEKFLTPALFVVFMGALVAAILSTVDSTLLTISAFVTHNLMGDGYYKSSEKKKLLYSRGLVVVSGLIAFALAYQAGGIYELVMLSSSMGSAGVLIITFTAIWKPSWAQKIPAVCCLGVGMVAFPLAGKVFHVEAPFLTSIVLSALAYFIPLVLLNTVKRQHQETA